MISAAVDSILLLMLLVGLVSFYITIFFTILQFFYIIFKYNLTDDTEKAAPA